MEEPPAELVARAVAGEVEAVDELLALLRPLILNQAQYRLRTYPAGRDLAEDATQETLLALVRALPRYVDQGKSFAGFVVRIAGNKIADQQRGRKTWRDVPTEEIPDGPDLNAGPERLAVARSQFRDVLAALDVLTPKYRAVLLLRGDGLSGPEIGARLGMTDNAVRVAQHRALARLREELG